jgi:Mg2+ and Co2+ transporter CorA
LLIGTTELVVTSFPQRWQQPKNDPLNVLDGIIEDMNAKTRPPVKSVYDLAMLITSRCSGMFDRHRLDAEELQFIDMFESSIGHVTNDETRLFDLFKRASAAAGKWLEIHRRPRGFGLWSVAEGAGDPRFQNALLDIGGETRLLTEIKDIRDELNMIKMVLKYQEQKLPDFADILIDELGKKSDEAYEIRIRSREQLKIVKMHLDDIERMDRQAGSIYTSLLSLLDLKQKHANAFEARFGRDQAAFSARSSKTIMVFTIVTIVFLPLSFIAAFFAINIQEFEHVGGTSQGALPLGYVSKYTFGIGLTISLPLIALAFAIDDIARYLPKLVRKAPWRMKRGKEDGERKYGDAGAEKNHRRDSEYFEAVGKGNYDLPDGLERKSFGDRLSAEVRSHSRTTQVSWARSVGERVRGMSDDVERGRVR